MTAASMGRQSRQIVRGLTAHLTGKSERGQDRKVRRGSYDVDDRRAQVFRPIADGTTVGALGWIDCFLRTISEWDDLERMPGGARPLGFAGLRVLETLLGRRGKIAVDFKTGRLDPAIDTIAKAARLSRTTVISALAKLKALKILDWVRRSQKTDNAGEYGPQREQVTNAYFLTPEHLPARVFQRLRDLVARKRLKRANDAPMAAPPPPPGVPANPELAAVLASIGRAVAEREDASPPSGQYPRSEIKG